MGSFAREGLGTPEHLAASGEAWLNDMAGAESDQTETGPRGVESRGPQSDLIRRLFATEDEGEMARSLVSAMVGAWERRLGQDASLGTK